MKTENIITLSDGRKLAYAEYGDPKGKPLFYFHGWPGSRLRSGFYDKIATKLHIRIISPDRPGYGLSDYKKNRTLLDYPDDMVELADKLKIKKFAIVGVSGGGPYAAVCAYKIPERIAKAGIVVGLAPTHIPGNLDGMPLVYSFGWRYYSKLPLIAYIGSWYHSIEAKYFPTLFSKIMFLSKSDQKMIHEVEKGLAVTSREAFRQGYKGPAKDLLLYTNNWGFDLRKIKAKVYLWFGEDDKNVPLVMGKYFAKQIPGSKLTVYPGEGHLISITHASEIFEELVKV